VKWTSQDLQRSRRRSNPWNAAAGEETRLAASTLHSRKTDLILDETIFQPIDAAQAIRGRSAMAYWRGHGKRISTGRRRRHQTFPFGAWVGIDPSQSCSISECGGGFGGKALGITAWPSRAAVEDWPPGDDADLAKPTSAAWACFSAGEDRLPQGRRIRRWTSSSSGRVDRRQGDNEIGFNRVAPLSTDGVRFRGCRSPQSPPAARNGVRAACGCVDARATARQGRTNSAWMKSSSENQRPAGRSLFASRHEGSAASKVATARRGPDRGAELFNWRNGRSNGERRGKVGGVSATIVSAYVAGTVGFDGCS
jgi:hypothetical protein